MASNLRSMASSLIASLLLVAMPFVPILATSSDGLRPRSHGLQRTANYILLQVQREGMLGRMLGRGWRFN